MGSLALDIGHRLVNFTRAVCVKGTYNRAAAVASLLPSTVPSLLLYQDNNKHSHDVLHWHLRAELRKRQVAQLAYTAPPQKNEAE